MKSSQEHASQDCCEVLVFGPQALKLGDEVARVTEVEFPIRTSELLEQLASQFPALASSMAVSRLAINQEFADAESLIHLGDEVALIGLISGG